MTNSSLTSILPDFKPVEVQAADSEKQEALRRERLRKLKASKDGFEKDHMGVKPPYDFKS